MSRTVFSTVEGTVNAYMRNDFFCMVDHPAFFATYVAAPEAETIDAIIRGDPDEIERACFLLYCVVLHQHGSPSHVKAMAQGRPRPHGPQVSA